MRYTYLYRGYGVSSVLLLKERLYKILVWSGQPAVPSRAAFVLGAEFAGVDVATKLTNVRAQLVEKKCDALLVAALDEVAWLFNLRGADIEFNPVVIAYAIVAVDNATLFVNAAKLDHAVRAHLVGRYVVDFFLLLLMFDCCRCSCIVV